MYAEYLSPIIINSQNKLKKKLIFSGARPQLHFEKLKTQLNRYPTIEDLLFLNFNFEIKDIINRTNKVNGHHNNNHHHRHQRQLNQHKSNQLQQQQQQQQQFHNINENINNNNNSNSIDINNNNNKIEQTISLNKSKDLVIVPLDTIASLKNFENTLANTNYLYRILPHARRLLTCYLFMQTNYHGNLSFFWLYFWNY